tara:strand:- start:109 stop:336 length:228 start_codon:yes stop_codon:yes gene_type:complete
MTTFNIDGADKRDGKRELYSRMIAFYRDQLQKFYHLGIGNKTEFRVTVTDALINVTKKRLNHFIGMRRRLIRRLD